MIRKTAAVVVLGIALSQSAVAQNALDLEAGYVIPGYNDVAIPGDTGTRFSLTDDLDADETMAFRLRFSHAFSEKHWVGVLVAPLTMKSHGTLDKDVDFNEETFSEGTSVDATFRFDSYRLIYRYLFHKSERWQFSFGAAAKLRDAAIKLEGEGLETEKTNTGVVPLLSFNLTWTPVAKWHLLVDGEALAAPQGRAEDVLFAAQYDVNERLALKTGYRVLEGGSDNDEVYTFSLFHYIVAGAVLSF
jgi:hypothetical protein